MRHGAVSTGVYFSQSTGSVYALLYVWVGFQAAYFLSNRHATLHLGGIAVAYALALASVPGADRGQRWLLLCGVVAVIALMVAVLRERVNRLIATLADAARTDALTGLLNRRGFQELMEVEIERALRSSRPLAILIGDLDHFKHLNDRYGHAAGDLALKRFAEYRHVGEPPDRRRRADRRRGVRAAPPGDRAARRLPAGASGCAEP